MFEIDLEAVLSLTIPPFRYTSFSKFPGTSRDLAIVAPVSVSSGEILSIIKEHGGEYLKVHLSSTFTKVNISKLVTAVLQLAIPLYGRHVE